jgi:hypothetical protein
MTTKEAYGLKYEPAKFMYRDNAFRFAGRSKSGVVMLGDDERYWVVCLADASRLAKFGIEEA